MTKSLYCTDSQITSLKLYLIVTLFVNFKHNFHKENETFKKKIKIMAQREKLEDGAVFVRVAISYP